MSWAGHPCWEDVEGLDESAVGQVDGGRVVEINGDLGELVLLGSRTGDIAIDQELKLNRSQSWSELERSTEERLSDGERGIRHRESSLTMCLIDCEIVIF